MRRINTANKAVDLHGAGKHGFKDGNLAAGIAPTELEAELFNGLQEELLSIIEAAGIAPAAGAYNQLLLALRGAGVLTTPPIFDESTKGATTEFVRRAQGSLRGVKLVNANTVLLNTDVGQLVTSSAAAGGIVITLPPANSVPAGSAISFRSSTGTGADFTVAAAAGDDVRVGFNALTTSLSVKGHDAFMLVSNGATRWFLANGSLSEHSFAASLAANGYQKLPSGLIVQWGNGTTVSGVLAVTYPIAFPAVNLVTLACDSASALSSVHGIGVDRGGGSLTGFTAYTTITTTAAAANSAFLWLALGY